MATEKQKKLAASFPYAVPQCFVRFLDNNHEGIAVYTKRGGAVSFTRHLGTPMNAKLWEDLVERLGCLGLRIYGPGFDGAWTMGFFGPGAFIYLDENFLVRDIEFQP
ncbi:MAG: hypothetical protein E6G97_18160 [Alphaproteobacteria bacterium]|nr:MAG: hypothetical protein E6G97_18160 [Alphaproteobacteria bacterium]